MIRLNILVEGRAEQFKTLDGPAVIGRAESCDLVLADEEVSRRHCRIEPSERGCVLIDLGSKNGFFVKGNRATHYELVPGDEVRIGRSILRLEQTALSRVEIPQVPVAIPGQPPDAPAALASDPPQCSDEPQLPLHGLAPDVAQMLRELAPNPEDYLQNDQTVVLPPPSSPESAAVREAPPRASDTPAPSAAKSAAPWSSLIPPPTPPPAKGKASFFQQIRKKKSNAQERKNSSAKPDQPLPTPKPFMQDSAKRTLLIRLGIVVTAIGILYLGYQMYVFLSAGPSAPAASQVQHPARPAHSKADD